MTDKEWVEAVPSAMRDDPVWRVEAYRLALFAGDLASHLLDNPPMSDAEQPHAPRTTHHVSTSHAPRTTHHALES